MHEQCQVCGRRQGAKADGCIRMHHRGGRVCLGSGQVPWSEGIKAAEKALDVARRALAAHDAVARRHRDERRNEPLTVDFYRDGAAMAREVSRLSSRIHRRLNADERQAKRQARADRLGVDIADLHD